jgi:hypothetical protein
MSSVVSTCVPEEYTRDFRASKTVQELKNELLADGPKQHETWLCSPIYKVTVKYFSPKNPLKVVYCDSTNRFIEWCEYIGNIHAVCLTNLTGLEIRPETRETLPGDSYGKLHKALYTNPYPIHNGRSPIINKYHLCDELERFSSDMLVAEQYYDVKTKTSYFDTICDVSSTPSYYDGYPSDYTYSDDGQFITGYTRVCRNKVELAGCCMSDINFYDYPDRRKFVYTNVDSSLIEKRKQLFEESLSEWIEYQRKRGSVCVNQCERESI